LKNATSVRLCSYISFLWSCGYTTLTRTGVGRLIYRSVPLTLLTALQCFRFFVELYLDQLWKLGLLPKTMTFHGANVDVIIGCAPSALMRQIGWVEEGRISGSS
jgi:hypothetical protein